jgi:transcriptional/translational regulatory protein YebC/TACO1
VAYLFSQKGQIFLPIGVDEAAILELALEAGAEDIETQEDGSVLVTTAFETFGAVRQGLEKSGFVPERADIALIPSLYVNLDLAMAEKFIKMIDLLEDLEDVQEVYSNAELPEDLLAQLAL